MTHRMLTALALTASLSLAAPLAAQTTETEEDGRSLMERGAELFWEGLSKEMAPTLEDLRGMAESFGPSMRSFFEEMGPAMAEMMEQVKDWAAYHPPEMLPNGDIIMRKKTPEEMEPDTSPPSGQEQPPSSGTDI